MSGLPPIASTGQAVVASRKRKGEEDFQVEEEVEVAKTSSAIACLPGELVSHALSFLSPEELARASSVSREWRALASTEGLWQAFDLKKVGNCNVIDEAVWAKHADLAALGLDASDAPPIDKRTAIPFMNKLSRQVDNNAGVTLLTIPKGLTLNKLIELAAAPKQGHATRFEYIWPRIVQDFGNRAVDKTYTVVITNSILKGSRDKLAIQRNLAQENGGELPGFLQVTTLLFLTYISSPEGPYPTCLYSDYPQTYTHCQEQIEEYRLVVGDFSWHGPIAPNRFCYSSPGAGVMKEF